MLCFVSLKLLDKKQYRCQNNLKSKIMHNYIVLTFHNLMKILSQQKSLHYKVLFNYLFQNSLKPSQKILIRISMIKYLFLRNTFLLFQVVISHNNTKLIRLCVNSDLWMKIYYIKVYKSMKVRNWRQFKKNFWEKKIKQIKNKYKNSICSNAQINQIKKWKFIQYEYLNQKEISQFIKRIKWFGQDKYQLIHKFFIISRSSDFLNNELNKAEQLLKKMKKSQYFRIISQPL
ncbi:unnamed protein product [Paramecium pentaurelia]|uniref:Uncharacterized protein n=1 Tax=Paramecium pentaurelia TaxID=43138 RepID=A0A8S1UKQ4_9CILI|nr:unnamed protein product [Paramecium pentaurelia]